MLFWSTSHICTVGLESFVGKVVGDEGDAVKYARGEDDGGYSHRFERIGTDAFLDEQSAIKNGIEKVQRKIASIDKQFTKLLKLKHDLTQRRVA